MKKLFTYLGLFIVSVVIGARAYSTLLPSNGAQVVEQYKVADSPIWLLDGVGNLYTEGDINFGIIGTPFSTITALTTANTAGNSIGTKFPVFLTGANNAVEGSVVIASTTMSGQVTVAVSTGTAQTSAIGIASAAGTSGNVISVYNSGYVLALTSGTVAAGDTLVTTVNGAGYLTSSAGATTGVVAIAVTAGPASLNGLTKVKLVR